jgi:hypothetical protein
MEMRTHLILLLLHDTAWAFNFYEIMGSQSLEDGSDVDEWIETGRKICTTMGTDARKHKVAQSSLLQGGG